MRSRPLWLGLLVGVALGTSPACAGKGKGSRNPEQCMSNCEQEKCAFMPDQLSNDEYLECLEACQDNCS